MGAPMGGFFDGADVVFATPAFSAIAPEIPTMATTLPTVLIDEGTHTRKVSKATHILAETLTPREVATTIQTEAASPVTPLVISTSDPFAVLSQAVKDSSSIVVTPSSIPSSATRGPDVDLSSEGSEDVLEDPDNEPVSKKRISNSDKEENVPLEAEFMGMCLSPFLFFFFSGQIHSSPFFVIFFLTCMYLCLPFLLQSPFICIPISLFL